MKLSDAQKLLDTQKMMFRINGREEMAVAIDTVLQALEELQKENEGIKARVDKYLQGGNETLRLEHEETLKYYHENYISKDKIKEKIEETRSKMHKFESDNANRLYLEHFNQNYFNKQSKNYGVFNTQEVITHCRLQEYVTKMGALQELLKGE